VHLLPALRVPVHSRPLALEGAHFRSMVPCIARDRRNGAGYADDYQCGFPR